MNACAFVGRVGGLALALGIGGAVFAAQASAEESPSDTARGPASVSKADAAAGPARSSRVGASARPAAATVARPAAANLARPAAPTLAAPAAPASQGEARARRDAARASKTLVAPAVTRSEAPAPSARAATTSPGGVFGDSITVTSTSLDWNEGIIDGEVDATSARQLPLTYKVLTQPDQGGKVNLISSAGAGKAFSYLPYMTTLNLPGQTEEFRILITESTPFDRFVKGLPVVGLFADPVLDALRRTPVIGDLLSPIIGDAVVVSFDADPAGLAAGRPVAFTYKMPSFDGTLISLNYYPSLNVATGQAASAPTVLNGPDLGFPGNTATTQVWAPSLVEIVPGIPTLREGASPFVGGYTASTGFNVITWDPRGEWASGGVMQLDSPFYEARDVTSIISWAGSADNIAASQVAADDGDPLIGMVGGSYGGGIQFTTAAIDPRIDAIVPSIAWNTLNESLYPDSTFKTVIGTELLLALVATGARFNGEIPPAIVTGDLFSWLSQSAQAVLSSAGPGILSANITAPTLFQQGTVDILFELDAANVNAQYILGRNPQLPVKTTWFCGGHGVCLLPQNLQQEQGYQNLNDTLRWLDAYAAGNAGAADQIPVFQWWDQTGEYHDSALAPFDPAFNNPDPLTYQGAGGGLVLVPLLGGSGPSDASVPPADPTVFSTAFALASGSRARNALNVDVLVPVGTRIAGTPTLSFNYAGLGTSRAVYAQLVDNATGQVVGNIVTPVPVILDGRERTVEIPLADIAYTVYGASDSLTLQITSSALPYANLTAWGWISVSDINLDLPTVAATR